MTARLAAAALVMVAALAGCPRFHPDKLPGAPADATFVEVDGVHVRYREAGSGPAVVLVHGYGASSDSWAPVIPAIAASHRVIAVDLKGFGWTSRPEGDYSPAAQAALVWGVLDKLGVKDVAIVGHSWGSSVALSMAVAHPDRVRRVALYAAYVYDDQVPGFFRWAEAPGLGELLFGAFYAERIEDRAALAYFDERWVTQARVERVEADLARPGTTAAALAVARKHHFGKLHEALRGFARPVLLLWGEEDQVTPVRFGHRLAEELADAELKTYPRCGHIPMVEARHRSNRDLAAFLAKDLAPPAPVPASTSSSSGDTGAGEASPPAASSAAADPIAGTARASGTAASSAPASVVEDAPPPRITSPALVPPRTLPIGADLAALGTELTPRQYASPREKVQMVVHGALRMRDAQLYDLDLDRGLDARGQPLFPIPLGGGQVVDALDLRARTDLAIYAPGVGVAVKARIDWLDNVALGGDPDLAGGSPATSGGQRPTAVVVKRAWGEVLTPLGTFAAGRMGANFGLGIAANGGDCEDCDGGDAADRAAFVTPLGGHVLALAYDIAARGPFTRSRDGTRPIALEPTDRAGGPTLALLRVHTPAALARRAAAGRTSVEYGAYLSRRTQDRDVPASYLTAASPAMYTGADLVARGFSATAAGGWLRVSNATVRVEAELAYAGAEIAQPSLIPGTEITTPITSQQLGAALQSDATFGRARLGFDAGFASGDDAPGFGAFPRPGELAPLPGALDGAQADPPRDRTVDNFRFHPDYRIDQILFREIIGTITDAVYLRPHVRFALFEVGTGRLELGAALIASWAIEPTSTPSGAGGLGVELDPQLRYVSADGLSATLDYGLFLPGAAFDSTTLQARPAQALRLRVAFVF
ncbi:MAG: alpha/beta fold hydrolase [Deltaproteobacteria bacterium]|nr:alpha/beta fold hydrolase [Deltaproteobacteria bacterium]